MVSWWTRWRHRVRARLARWDRTGARCPPLGGPVSPARPPNRTCGFHRIRLSTSASRLCDLRGRRPAPRRQDRRSAIAVTGHRHCSTVEQGQSVVLGPPPVGQVVPSQPPSVGTAMLAAQPADHPQPGELVQVGEGVLGHAVAEVVGPAPQHPVQAAQEAGEGLFVPCLVIALTLALMKAMASIPPSRPPDSIRFRTDAALRSLGYTTPDGVIANERRRRPSRPLPGTFVSLGSRMPPTTGIDSKNTDKRSHDPGDPASIAVSAEVAHSREATAPIDTRSARKRNAQPAANRRSRTWTAAR